ncbi:MAG: hypothetical protein ACLU38_12370 [Dysosmobacter sp.]
MLNDGAAAEQPLTGGPDGASSACRLENGGERWFRLAEAEQTSAAQFGDEAFDPPARGTLPPPWPWADC